MNPGLGADEAIMPRSFGDDELIMLRGEVTTPRKVRANRNAIISRKRRIDRLTKPRGRAGRSAIKKRLKRSKMENQKMILAASKSGRLTDFDVFKLQCFLSEVEAKKKPSLDSLEPSVRQFLEELNELEAMRTAEEAVVVAAQVEADRVFLEEATAADKILMEGAAAPDRNSIDWMRPRRLTADEKEEYLRSLLGGKTDVEEEMKMDVEAEREEMVVGEERGREREMGMEMPDVGRLALGSEENML